LCRFGIFDCCLVIIVFFLFCNSNIRLIRVCSLCFIIEKYHLRIVDLILNPEDPNYGPIHLTINTIPSNRINDRDLHHAPVRDRLHPLSKMVQEEEGFVVHKFEVDGTANVCLRASAASPTRPVAFAMRIETDDEIPAELLDNGSGGAKKRKQDVPAANVDEHLGHMERELVRISGAMEHVLREADANKDQDALFHEQTMAMHSATTFWPIVQVGVLLMTGFTQASHIVRFFKSRRII
jgi:emp24/gp25L/p24 family/GOLD